MRMEGRSRIKLYWRGNAALEVVTELTPCPIGLLQT